eukprot:scaffold23.g4110.t1
MHPQQGSSQQPTRRLPSHAVAAELRWRAMLALACLAASAGGALPTVRASAAAGPGDARRALHQSAVQDAAALGAHPLGAGGADAGAGAAMEDATAAAWRARSWPEGYVAVCAATKDRPDDLREWIEYHHALGVDRFYIFATDSLQPYEKARARLLGTRPRASCPLAAPPRLPRPPALADLTASGVVEYHALPWVTPLTVPLMQVRLYYLCLKHNRHRHAFLGFWDVDEFLVPMEPSLAAQARARFLFLSFLAVCSPARLGTPGRAGALRSPGAGGGALRARRAHLSARAARPSSRCGERPAVRRAPQERPLPTYLRRLEGVGGLVVNWRLMGSSGHKARPEGGVVRSFLACTPADYHENHQLKSIVNTLLVDCPTTDPHHFIYKGTVTPVDTAGVPTEGPSNPEIRGDTWVLFHYVIKSEGEYRQKMARGSAMGNHKTMAFFERIDAEATESCPQALEACRRWGVPQCQDGARGPRGVAAAAAVGDA